MDANEEWIIMLAWEEALTRKIVKRREKKKILKYRKSIDDSIVARG